MSLKVAASGWPSEMEDDPSRQAEYLAEYAAIGVIVKSEDVKKNSGRRTVTKYLLNSAWGKLAQRPDLNTTEFVSDPTHLRRLLRDDKLEIDLFKVLTPNLCAVSYKTKADYQQENKLYSPTTAAFVTASGRRMLYEVASKLGDQLIYMDTDRFFIYYYYYYYYYYYF
jgi:DNA polymerase elongation subunit (family B)